MYLLCWLPPPGDVLCDMNLLTREGGESLTTTKCVCVWGGQEVETGSRAWSAVSLFSGCILWRTWSMPTLAPLHTLYLLSLVCTCLMSCWVYTRCVKSRPSPQAADRSPAVDGLCPCWFSLLNVSQDEGCLMEAEASCWDRHVSFMSEDVSHAAFVARWQFSPKWNVCSHFSPSLFLEYLLWLSRVDNLLPVYTTWRDVIFRCVVWVEIITGVCVSHVSVVFCLFLAPRNSSSL